jgi:hypothetical protein
MNDGKFGYRIANIQDGAVHGIGEHNFPWLEFATRNQNGCSSPGCKNWNLVNAGLEKFMFICSYEKLECYPHDGQLLELW